VEVKVSGSNIVGRRILPLETMTKML